MTHEDEEDRHQRGDRLLDAAQVQDDEDAACTTTSTGSFGACATPSGRKLKTRVGAGGDRDGDGQDVVDEQRAAGDHAGAVAEQLGGHHVAAAAVGKVLDDAAVGAAR